MTGCYNNRIGIIGALGPKSRTGLNPDETTLGEICKQQGYATACFGKWHLGHLKEFLPLQHGFDEFFGLPYSNDMWPYHPGVLHLPMEERLKRWPHLPLIEGNRLLILKHQGKTRTMTKQYTERAVSFIEKNKEEPFFVYLPTAWFMSSRVSDNFKGKVEPVYLYVMMEVDWSLGKS